MNILFLRHGETLLNKKKLVQGWSDSQLTDDAIKKTSDLAEFLKNNDIKYAYTSDFGRAIETCRIISSELNIPEWNVFVSRNFREYNYGYFEKQPESFMHSKIKKHMLTYGNKFDLFKIGILKNKSLESSMILDAIADIDKQFRPDASDQSMNTEEFVEYANRTLAELKESLLEHCSHNAIVVSHGHLLMTLLAIISPSDFKKKSKLQNLEGYVINFNKATSNFEFSGFFENRMYENKISPI